MSNQNVTLHPSFEHNMALPDLDRLTGESFLFGHSSGIYSGCTCCSFSVFFQYIIITNLLGPTVTFPGSRAQSGKFGAFGAFLTGPFPGFDVAVL